MDTNKMAGADSEKDYETISGMRRTIIPGLVKEEAHKSGTETPLQKEAAGASASNDAAVANEAAATKNEAATEAAVKPAAAINSLPNDSVRKAALTFVPKFQNMQELAKDKVAELGKKPEDLQEGRQTVAEQEKPELAAAIRQVTANPLAGLKNWAEGTVKFAADKLNIPTKEAEETAEAESSALNKERRDLLQNLRQVQPLAPQTVESKPVDLSTEATEFATDMNSEKEVAKALAKEREERFKLWEKQTSPKRQPGQTASALRLEQARQATLQRRALTENLNVVRHNAPTGIAPVAETASTATAQAAVTTKDLRAEKVPQTVVPVQVSPFNKGVESANEYGQRQIFSNAEVEKMLAQAEAEEVVFAAKQNGALSHAADRQMEQEQASQTPYNDSYNYSAPQSDMPELPQMYNDYYNNDNNYNYSYNEQNAEGGYQNMPNYREQSAYYPNEQRNYPTDFDPQQFAAYNAAKPDYEEDYSYFANGADVNYNRLNNQTAYADYNNQAYQQTQVDYEQQLQQQTLNPANDNGNNYDPNTMLYDRNALQIEETYGEALANDTGVFAAVLTSGNDLLQLLKVFFMQLPTKAVKTVSRQSSMVILPLSIIYFVLSLIYAAVRVTRSGLLSTFFVAEGTTNVSTWGNLLLAILASIVNILLLVAVLYLANRLSSNKYHIMQVLNGAACLLLIQTVALLGKFILGFVWLPFVTIIDTLAIAYTALYGVKLIAVYNEDNQTAAKDFLQVLFVPLLLLLPVILSILF